MSPEELKALPQSAFQRGSIVGVCEQCGGGANGDNGWFRRGHPGETICPGCYAKHAQPADGWVYGVVDNDGEVLRWKPKWPSSQYEYVYPMGAEWRKLRKGCSRDFCEQGRDGTRVCSEAEARVFFERHDGKWPEEPEPAPPAEPVGYSCRTCGAMLRETERQGTFWSCESCGHHGACQPAVWSDLYQPGPLPGPWQEPLEDGTVLEWAGEYREPEIGEWLVTLSGGAMQRRMTTWLGPDPRHILRPKAACPPYEGDPNDAAFAAPGTQCGGCEHRSSYLCRRPGLTCDDMWSCTIRNPNNDCPHFWAKTTEQKEATMSTETPNAKDTAMNICDSCQTANAEYLVAGLCPKCAEDRLDTLEAENSRLRAAATTLCHLLAHAALAALWACPTVRADHDAMHDGEPLTLDAGQYRDALAELKRMAEAKPVVAKQPSNT